MIFVETLTIDRMRVIGSNFIRCLLRKHLDCKIITPDKLAYTENLNNLKDIEKNKNYPLLRISW